MKDLPSSKGISHARTFRGLAAAAALLSSLLVGGCLERAVSTVDGEESSGNTMAVSFATLPSLFAEATVASGLSSPTAMAIAPDGRILICEQGGRLRVVKSGALLSTPAITLTVNTSGERGLLGVAVDPAFSTNRYIYLFYTSTSGSIHNRVSRFTMGGDVVSSGSELQLLNLPTLSAINHNGGAVRFGPDGKLYVATGDNKTGSNSQSKSSVFGKILRINPGGGIPSDNPFYASTSGNNRAIWALGLRNPFTFAFQRTTGRMFINDVGEASWEEIDDGVAGGNYGWPGTEGKTTNTSYKSPVYAYSRTSPNCAIIGGAFYNPSTAAFPSDYVGDYFFGDYCGGTIRRRDSGGSVSGFAAGISSLVDIQVASDGSLYYLARGGGVLKRIRYTGSLAPTIGQHPASITVSVGQTATFTVQANGSGLAYQWQRNGSNITGATSASYSRTNVQATDNGSTYRCVVGNSAGTVTTSSATLTVTTNKPPVAGISTPNSGTTYGGGQAIGYSGTGTDPEDGVLPASAFTWEVVFHHGSHTHPFVAAISGSKSGSFTIPAASETASDVFYRIHLTVRDSKGLTHHVTRDVLPRTVTITLASNPTGLVINLDGQPRVTPYTFTGVVGITRVLEAVSPQSLGTKSYNFSSWSDGGSRSHSISTPSSPATFTAAFAEGAAGSAYEAEKAVLSGAVVASSNGGFTGTGYADYVNLNGDYVEWTVGAAASGTRTLQFRHANGGSTARTLRITINGGSARDIAFPSTGAWTNWQGVNTSAALNAGANKVRATAIGGSGPNLDHLRIY